jgi:uncharacterized protein (DUF697 family)
MHNLSNRYYQSEFESPYNQEYSNETDELAPEFETTREFENGYHNEYSGQNGNELSPEFEFEQPGSAEFEMEMAQELMEISNEYEFGSWLKRLAKKGAGLASNVLNSPVGQQATAALGGIAQKTLPGLGAKGGAWLGGKLGSLVGQSGYGQKLGAQLGGSAGQTAAGRYPDFVKFAGNTLQNLAQEMEAGAMPAVKPALVKAAAKHYPIILKVKGTLHARPVSGALKSEFEFENNYEYANEYANETSYEAHYEGELTNESTFNEVTEMELASELLAIQNEAELDQFLGKLFKKGLGAVSKFAGSSLGKNLGGMLKGIAKKALPLAGRALGSMIAPGIGTAIGGALGNVASNLFELEMEGLSPEDREFEMARAYVRFAGNAAHRASRMRNQPPRQAARQAVVQAARHYAPGLLVRDRYDQNDAAGGNWYREGNRIIIEGA